jgi:hypothetical protein
MRLDENFRVALQVFVEPPLQPDDGFGRLGLLSEWAVQQGGHSSAIG